MSETQSAVSIFILLLLVASAVAMVTKWVRLPYTLALVIVGLVISPMHFLPAIQFSPELILLIFLPALLFEAAWNLELEQLRANWLPILLLAIPGVLVSAGVVGAVLREGTGLPWRFTLLFGAMISATDPVSVLALFRKFGLPRRLSTIVEGESLFNDGTAAVVFQIVLGFVLTGPVASPGALALGAMRQFGVVVFGGIAVGALVGLLISAVTSYIEDRLLEITLTTIAAYGSYLLANGLGVSPVIAVLVAGLVIGNYGRRTGMSASTDLAVTAFWEYAAFVANSLVFLLIGLQIHVSALADIALPIAWAVLAMLVGRAISVYGLLTLMNRVATPVSWRWQHVLFWGGLRGSLSIALVLSVPTAVSGRGLLVALIFGTVIFSLLVQGLTISPLMKRVRLAQSSPKVEEYELLRGQMLTTTAAFDELEALRRQGMVTQRLYVSLKEDFLKTEQSLAEQLTKLQMSDEVLERDELSRIRQRLLDVKKRRLAGLLREGVISESTFSALHQQLNKRL